MILYQSSLPWSSRKWGNLQKRCGFHCSATIVDRKDRERERDLFFASAARMWAYGGHLKSGISLHLQGTTGIGHGLAFARGVYKLRKFWAALIVLFCQPLFLNTVFFPSAGYIQDNIIPVEHPRYTCPQLSTPSAVGLNCGYSLSVSMSIYFSMRSCSQNVF